MPRTARTRRAFANPTPPPTAREDIVYANGPATGCLGRSCQPRYFVSVTCGVGGPQQEGRVRVARNTLTLARCPTASTQRARHVRSSMPAPRTVCEPFAQKNPFSWLGNGFTSHGARALHAEERIPAARERVHPAWWTSRSRRRARSCGSGMSSPRIVHEPFTQRGASPWPGNGFTREWWTSPSHRRARSCGSGRGLPGMEDESFTQKGAFPRLGNGLTRHGARVLHAGGRVPEVGQRAHVAGARTLRTEGHCPGRQGAPGMGRPTVCARRSVRPWRGPSSSPASSRSPRPSRCRNRP